MDFQLNEVQLMIQKSARDYAKKLVEDVVERDDKSIYPTEHVKVLKELGFLGMMASEKYGGGGMDTVSYVLAMEEISKMDSSVAVIMTVCNSLVNWGLDMQEVAVDASSLPELSAGYEYRSFRAPIGYALEFLRVRIELLAP